MPIDPRSGFCSSTSIFYSKRKPIPLPQNNSLDLTTFISSQAHNGKIAYIDAITGQNLTFAQVWKSVDSLSSCLYDHGIRKGHVVLLLSPNSIYFPVICLSVMSLGAIITTTNPLNTTQEIAKQIKDSKPVLAFTTPSLLPKVARADLPIVLINHGHDQTHKMNTGNANIVSSLEEMLRKEATNVRVKERVSLDDTASLLYSSGTTGASKGVMSSHGSLIAMVQTIMSRFNNKESDVEKGDGEKIFICTVPMFHIYGLAAFASGLLASGSTIVILSQFEINEMLSAIGKYKVTNLPLVPPILIALINNAKALKAKYNLESLRWVLSGGAPLSKEVIDGFTKEYPMVNISQGYGLTETAAIGASTDTMEESRRYGTAGLLSPSMEAKIVDPETGKALSVNQTGELWVRGPTVMKGYFSNPEATTSTLDSSGWLRTGDLCFFDEDGFIFVVDRLKELIKYKGYQVPPAELEALLLTHPEIVDTAVIPFPDEEVGQYPMAYVVRKEDSNLSEGSVIDFVAKQVAPYKKVRKVAFVPSVPKNPSGKILRKDLIKLATSKM